MVVQASDADTGARITYRIITPGQPFSADQNSGAILLNARLDFETILQHVFTVEASDNGSPPAFAEAQVSISVLDANDIPPRFLESSYSCTIEEGQPPGAECIQVQAVDDDGTQNAVVYQLTNPQAAFSIDGLSGWIETSDVLDRERRSSYRLQATALDTGLPPRFTDVTVTVTVTDINDNNPVFKQSTFLPVVSEAVEPGRPSLIFNNHRACSHRL